MKKRTVLVVDDEEQVEEMIETFLSKRGYQTISFVNSENALRFIKKNSQMVDLVITDLKMPRLSGVELARRMLDTDKGIPVILVTGFLEGSPDGVPNIKKVLEKPVLKKELLEAVDDLLTAQDSSDVHASTRGTAPSAEVE
jgi:FixJ family two-component response regulator